MPSMGEAECEISVVNCNAKRTCTLQELSDCNKNIVKYNVVYNTIYVCAFFSKQFSKLFVTNWQLQKISEVIVTFSQNIKRKQFVFVNYVNKLLLFEIITD